MYTRKFKISVWNCTVCKCFAIENFEDLTLCKCTGWTIWDSWEWQFYARSTSSSNCKAVGNGFVLFPSSQFYYLANATICKLYCNLAKHLIIIGFHLDWMSLIFRCIENSRCVHCITCIPIELFTGTWSLKISSFAQAPNLRSDCCNYLFILIA